MKWFAALLLFWAVPGWGAEVRLTPARVENGGVVRLQYRGPSPSLVVARWNDRLVYLDPVDSGARALIGVDLEQAPGRYPLPVAVVDASGSSHFYTLVLQVTAARHGVERLELPEALANPRGPRLLARIALETRQLRKIFAGQTPGLAAIRLQLPVPDPVSSPFGLGRILNGVRHSPHAGIDFRSPAGRRVGAAGSGQVAFVGDLYFTGRTVVLDHGEGLYTLYAHLQQTTCRVGEELRGGQTLGRVGSSGRSTGPHLHWGAKLRGARIDPLALVATAGKSLDSPQGAGNNENSPSGMPR